MGEVTRIVPTEATIEKAQQDREEHTKGQKFEAELEGTKARARQFAANHGAHVITPDGYKHHVTLRATAVQPLPEGRIKVGQFETTREGARLAGLVDEHGALTEKGKALTGEPAPAARRESSQPSRPSFRPGHSPLGDFEVVAAKNGTDLANVPASDVRAMIAQLRQPRLLGANDKAAAERDAVRLEAELARREGDAIDSDEGDDDAADDQRGDERSEIELDEDYSDAADAQIAAGQHDAVIDAAEVAIGSLNQSTAFAHARNDYLSGENLSAQAVAGIAQELGISNAEAGQRIDAVFDGFRAEASRAVSGILSASEAASFAEYIVDAPEIFSRAAAAHVRAGSTVGWVSAARDFKAKISAAGDINAYLGRHRGGEVVESDDGRYVLQREGRPATDLLAAIASGLVRPA